jgi:hypothetical protein
MARHDIPATGESPKDTRGYLNTMFTELYNWAFVHDATAKTTPVDADEMGITDSAASYVLKKVTWANIKATLKTYFDTLYPPFTGWQSYSAVTPTRASADDPTYVLTFAGVNLTGVMSVGMKVKFTQNSATVYGIITAISFSTNTTMTLYCGTDYDVLDTASYAISAFNYSPHKAPFGFPLDPTKWSILTTSSSSRSTVTPTAGTWYNAENIVIPIGCWLVSYSCNTGGNNNSSDLDFFSTLSTANNSESDADFTANTQLTTASYIQTTMGRDKYLTLAAKTTYYLNYMTNRTSVEEVNIAGNRSKTMIRAVCAYL